MIKLIKKELYLSRYVVFLMGLFTHFFGSSIFLARDYFGAYIIFLIMNLLISFMVLGTNLKKDMEDKGDILMYSLPVNRRHIIMSKYLSISIYPIISSVVLYLYAIFYRSQSMFNFLGDFTGMNDRIGPELILFSIGACLLFVAIVIPMSYWLGRKATIIGPFLILLLLSLPGLSIRLFPASFIMEDNYFAAIGSVVISLILMFISMKLTLRNFGQGDRKMSN